MRTAQIANHAVSADLAPQPEAPAVEYYGGEYVLQNVAAEGHPSYLGETVCEPGEPTLLHQQRDEADVT